MKEAKYTDSFDVEYTTDKKTILFVPRETEEYTILEGVETIASSAFRYVCMVQT